MLLKEKRVFPAHFQVQAELQSLDPLCWESYVLYRVETFGTEWFQRHLEHPPGESGEHRAPPAPSCLSPPGSGMTHLTHLQISHELRTASPGSGLAAKMGKLFF